MKPKPPNKLADQLESLKVVKRSTEEEIQAENVRHAAKLSRLEQRQRRIVAKLAELGVGRE